MKPQAILFATACGLLLTAPQLAAQQSYTLSFSGGQDGDVPNQPPCATPLVPAAGQYLVTTSGAMTETVFVLGTPIVSPPTSAFYWSVNGTSNPTLFDPQNTSPPTICVNPGETLYFWPVTRCTQSSPPAPVTVTGATTITLQPVNPVTVTSASCSGGTLATSLVTSPLSCGTNLTLSGPSGAFYWVIASPSRGNTTFPDNNGPFPICTGGIASLLNNQVAIGVLSRNGVVQQPLVPLPGLAGVTLYCQAFAWKPAVGPMGFEAGSSDVLAITF